MKSLDRAMQLAAAALVLIISGISIAGGYATRQYYSGWHSTPRHSYHYRHYYYKPHADYAGYRYHYVIYYPSRPHHAYYYNPYSHKYWGRCPLDHGGKGQYSLLAEQDRKGRLEDIPESAFPQPGPMPPIPESRGDDGEPMDLPPGDLPTDENLPGR